MHDTEEIKQRLPIEQLVGSYLPLKKAGRIYKANCPFHQEKTPSFTVNPEREIFKCFGCNEGGDIFDFVMKIEGLSFPEALQLLAEKAGVTLEHPPRSEFTTPGLSTSQSTLGKSGGSLTKARLYSLNQYVARLWHTILSQHPKAQMARDYLSQRGLTPESWEKFQIGYAPYGPTTAQALHKVGFSSAEIQASGDPAKFQDRILFPIADVTGRIVGFTGRLLEHPDDPSPTSSSRGPKYWNTPETAIFIKSKAVFALHLAKHSIQQEDCALIAEGQMDVIMLHQHGYPNAVASSGTALTEQQLRLIGRFSNRVAFAYDQDAAGIEATKRGIELALASGLLPYVVVTPVGKDPAECLSQNPQAWKQAYQKRRAYMDWLLDQIMTEQTQARSGTTAGKGKETRLSEETLPLDPLRKKAIVQAILPWLLRIQDPVEQAEWLRVVAGRSQIEESGLRTALQRAHKETASPSASKPSQPLLKEPSDPLRERAELAVAFIVAFPSLVSIAHEQLQGITALADTPYLQTILPAILSLTPEASHTYQDIIHAIPDPAQQKAVALRSEELLQPYTELEIDTGRAVEEFLIMMQRLRSDLREAAKSRLAKEIQAAQQDQDGERLKRLFKDLQNLL